MALDDEAIEKIEDCLRRTAKIFGDCICIEMSPAAWDALEPVDTFPPTLADKGPVWEGLPGTHPMITFIHETRQIIKKAQPVEKKRHAEVCWSSEDVREKFDVTEEEANEFLANNANHIQEAMIPEGWTALEVCGDFDGLQRKEETL